MFHPTMTKNNFLLWHQTSLYFFNEIYIQRISGPPTTSRINFYIILFPREKDGKVYVENGIYDMNNQQKNQFLSMRSKEDSVLA